MRLDYCAYSFLLDINYIWTMPLLGCLFHILLYPSGTCLQIHCFYHHPVQFILTGLYQEPAVCAILLQIGNCSDIFDGPSLSVRQIPHGSQPHGLLPGHCAWRWVSLHQMFAGWLLPQIPSRSPTLQPSCPLAAAEFIAQSG